MRWSYFSISVLLCVAVLLVATTCKTEHMENSSTTAGANTTDTDPKEQEQAQQQTLPALCDGITQDQLCQANPCPVALHVSDDNDEVTANPNPVYVLRGQTVEWSAQGTKNKSARVKKVHFRNPNDSLPKKKNKNTKTQIDPDCSELDNKCNKTIGVTDFVPCETYYYDALVRHGTKEKKSDPELVIAGTTTIFGQ